MDETQTLADRTTTVSPAEVEAALLDGYSGFVRLAYLILPPSLGRHRRILAAHGVVQRALPDRRRLERQLAGETDPTVYLRRRVVQDSIRQATSRTPLRLLPQVWGLRLFPKSGAADDLAVDQALATSSPQARAAWALVRSELLSVDEAELQLRAIGVQHPQAAITEAATLDENTADDWDVFDPCAVRLAPTDLLRRRARGRAVTIAVTAVLAIVILTSLIATAGQDETATASPQAVKAALPKLTADALKRTEATLWQDTARVDFTAWPARGNRLADKALLDDALNAWSTGTGVTSIAGTPTDAPTQTPQLLYAGDVDGSAVVVLHDGRRLARYTKGTGLVVARTDDADVTTAAAVVLSESEKGVRYLTAPWISTAAQRDLVKPDAPAVNLPRTDGVTAEVARPTCSSWPTLQLRSASTVAEKHAFLVTFLGGLSPVHLTYMPPPTGGAARSPREATSSAALLTWAQTACSLQVLQNQGVKAANNWIFAEQPLPGGGQGNWVCTRSDTWEGGGWAGAQLLTPGSPGIQAGKAVNTAACSRFDQNVLASAYWRSPAGSWYLLAAGSRHTKQLNLTAPAVQSVPGQHLAVPAKGPGAPVKLRATLDNGTALAPLP